MKHIKPRPGLDPKSGPPYELIPQTAASVVSMLRENPRLIPFDLPSHVETVEDLLKWSGSNKIKFLPSDDPVVAKNESLYYHNPIEATIELIKIINYARQLANSYGTTDYPYTNDLQVLNDITKLKALKCAMCSSVYWRINK